jgi:hypothetical protein
MLINLSAKFVGVKPPKFIKELKFYIHHYDDYLGEQVRFLKDLGFEGKDEELVNDESSLTFDELTLEAINGVYIERKLQRTMTL